MGIRPATPGTLVVLAATVLLILVSVSTPLLKSIYFLEANLSQGNFSGTVRLGAWGYCVGSKCTSPKLGYSLNIAELLEINGRLSGISNSVLKWITYLMILHPIAAAFGVVSVIFGLLAHMRGFAGTALTTCFASFAATFSLLAFVFDIAVFVIAKQRIDSSSVGGNASLGPAVWMTLAAMIMFTLSGCFFGCGACVIRKQRAGREASEKNRPVPNEQYGSKLRGDALAAHERDKAYLAQNTRGEGMLPAFAEHEQHRDDIPLNSLQATAFPDDDYHPRHYPPTQQQPQQQVGFSAAPPSIISGVGEGYGRRSNAPPGLPVSLSPESSYSNLPPPNPTGTPNNAGRGAGMGIGSRLAADARAQRGYGNGIDDRRQESGMSATTEPFVGMHDPRQASYTASPPPMSQQGHYGSSSSYDHGQQQPSSSMPIPQQTGFVGARDPQQLSPTAYGGSYPAYPPVTAPPASLTPGGGAIQGSTMPYTSEKAAALNAYPTSNIPAPPPPPQQQQQHSYYVQNPSPSTHASEPSVHGYDQNQYLGGAPGGSTVDRAPSTHAPTYYTYDDPYAQQQQQQQPQGGGSVDYHQSGQQGGNPTDQYGYEYNPNRRY